MQYEPSVTVITPVLNGEQTIQNCIDSVAQQDYKNINHLVIDGGSSDGTIAILERAGLEFTSEPDNGIYAAFNKGISKAEGEIIHILNADDAYIHADVVRSMVNFMQASELDLAHAKVKQIDRRGKSYRVIGYDVARRQLLRKCKVAHPSVFVRASVYRKLGKYSEEFTVAADHEFFLRVWDRIRVGFMPEVIVQMQLGGISNSNVELSYRESMAAALLHGASPMPAALNYYWEIAKARMLTFGKKLSG